MYQLTQLAARDGDTYDITQKLTNRRKRTMAGAFHISNDSSKTRSDQLAFLNVGRHRCIVNLLAMLAPVAKAGMLFNVNRLFNNFNLLNNFAGVFNLFQVAAAVGTSVKRMGLECIYFVLCKRSSFVLGMSGLAAPIAGCVGFFSFAAV